MVVSLLVPMCFQVALLSQLLCSAHMLVFPSGPVLVLGWKTIKLTVKVRVTYQLCDVGQVS
jgi:hypothetical protein